MPLEEEEKEKVKVMFEIPKDLRGELKKQAADAGKYEKDFVGDIVVEALKEKNDD